MIRQFNLTLAANESREVALSGIYFQIFQMLQSLTLIEILDKSGGVISLIDSPLESMYIRATERFQTLRFSNGPTAQTVKFFYGDGDAGSNRFSGNITGTVAIDAPTLLSLNAARTVRPEAHTAQIIANSALAANTVETVLLPAANVNGLVILDALAMSYTTGNVFASGGGLLGKTTAPANSIDGIVFAPWVPKIYQSVNTLYNNEARTLYPHFVPAGLGLYWIFEQALIAPAVRYVRYRLL